MSTVHPSELMTIPTIGRTAVDVEGMTEDWQAVERRLQRESDELVGRVEAGVRYVSGELAKIRTAAHTYDLSELECQVGNLYKQLYALVAEATHDAYIAEDVESWCKYAESIGGVHPRLTAARMLDLIYYRAVPNAPLRAAYVATEEPSVEIALRVYEHLGAMELEDGADYESRQFADPDPSRMVHKLQRVLGLTAHMDSVRLFIPYEWAVAFARALDIDPRNCGI